MKEAKKKEANYWPRIIFSVVAGVVIIGFGIWLFGFLSEMKAAPTKREVPKRIKNVEVATITNAPVDATLSVQGRLEAYNKISLFTEVGGVVQETGKPFKKGTYFQKGETLMRIDDVEARLNLQSQKANLLNAVAMMMPDLKVDYPASFTAWEQYLAEFDVNASITPLPEPVSQREKLFVAGRNLYSQYYTIKSGEERLSKYTLRAPFSGVLTSTAVNQGAVIRTGQQLGELMANGYYELVATVPLSDLDYLKTGGKVALVSEDIAGTWRGKVRRISDQIDPNTQTVNVFIGVSGKNLREGMYLKGEADAKTIVDAVEIDRDLLIDQDEVYVVENDTLLRLMPVAVRKFNRKTVIVSGLPDGAALLTSDVAGAYDGMRVNVKGKGKAVEAATATGSQEMPVSK